MLNQTQTVIKSLSSSTTLFMADYFTIVIKFFCCCFNHKIEINRCFDSN